jgi:diguanylate cyclase (GGDEF)-like protein
VLVFKDITVAQELRRELAHSANHDPLTGLPNRTAFGRALAEATRQAVSEQRRHAVCFIDLDHFKPVNDQAGHAAGDALLQQVADVLRRACRAHDFVARLGGDEFVLLVDDCSLADAELAAGKLVASIASLRFTWHGLAYHIGASVGIAPITADAARDPLAEADAACYSAKSRGRGRVAIAGT